MSAAVTDLTVEQGATFRSLLYWTDENDQPIDLTGFTARMQVRRTVEATDIEAELTTENGGITLGLVVGPPPYNIELLLTAAQTEALDASASSKNWFYDLELVNGSTVTRLMRGRFRVSLEVTRA